MIETANRVIEAGMANLIQSSLVIHGVVAYQALARLQGKAFTRNRGANLMKSDGLEITQELFPRTSELDEIPTTFTGVFLCSK